MPPQAEITTRDVTANGLRFSCLEAGDGPLLLLLHGYPDNAWSWEEQLPVFAGAGYHTVAPFMRGYPPTETPDRAYYDLATLAADVRALIETLGKGEPAYLVGQDWGAAITYAVLAAWPTSVRRAVTLAVPHPVAIRRTLRRSPRHALRSFHWFLYQLPWLPEALVRFRDGAFIRTLWQLWSPDFEDEEHVADIREMMRDPVVVRNTLAYYRALFRESLQDPALASVRKKLSSTIDVPTLALCGAKDMRREMLEEQREFFNGEYRWRLVEGAGHFLHREQPDAVNGLILDWLHREQSSFSKTC